jgi:hypothetical protein
MTTEQKELAELIARCHGGQIRYNMVDAARIVGICRGRLPFWLNERGVMVDKTSKGKYVHVNDLVVAMTANRVSPL